LLSLHHGSTLRAAWCRSSILIWSDFLVLTKVRSSAHLLILIEKLSEENKVQQWGQE
jgi:hypothetical protein